MQKHKHLGRQYERKHGHAKKINLNWVTQFVLLGITFHLDLNKMININYEKGISDIENILNVYRKFKLSVLGKVNMIKTMAVPKWLCRIARIL